MNIIDIEKSVQKEINRRRLNAIESADEALKFLLKNDEIKKVYEKYQLLKVEYSKQLFLNDQKESKKLLKEMQNTKAEMKKYLDKNSINIDSLKPSFTCKKCQDKGEINGKKCSCYKNLLSKKLVEVSGLKYHDLPSFDKIKYDQIANKKQREELEKVGNVLKSFCEKFDSTKYNIILLCGLVGVGKTYQMECLINELIKNGYFVTYETAFYLNQKLIGVHLSPIDERAGALDQYVDCDCLCIDDLGTEQITKNVTIEYLYSIINERALKNKKTVITTNLNMAQLNERYGERIFSRLVDSNTCLKLELKGDDLRINKSK